MASFISERYSVRAGENAAWGVHSSVCEVDRGCCLQGASRNSAQLRVMTGSLLFNACRNRT